MGKVFERIYDEVKKIPRGKTKSYGEIAKIVGTSPRVVGFALHRNPDHENIPCHRVIFKDGSLSKSYAFGGIKAQRAKLLAESAKLNNLASAKIIQAHGGVLKEVGFQKQKYWLEIK